MIETIIYWLGVITLSSAFICGSAFLLILSAKAFMWSREWLFTEYVFAKALAIALIIKDEEKNFNFRGFRIEIEKGDNDD